MKNFKTRGIIIGKRDMGDFDRVFEILTEDKGKISCIARGIRRPKSKYKSILEIFNLLKLDLYPGKTFSYITQAQVLDSRIQVQKDLDKMQASFFASEIISTFLSENHIIPRVFPLYDSFFFLIGKNCPRVVFSAFVTKLLFILGHLSDFTKCERCHKVLEKGGEYYWHDGEIRCENCELGSRISEDAIKVFKFYSSNELETCVKIRLEKSLLKEIIAFLIARLESASGKKFSSSKIYDL